MNLENEDAGDSSGAGSADTQQVDLDSVTLEQFEAGDDESDGGDTGEDGAKAGAKDDEAGDESKDESGKPEDLSDAEWLSKRELDKLIKNPDARKRYDEQLAGLDKERQEVRALKADVDAAKFLQDAQGQMDVAVENLRTPEEARAEIGAFVEMLEGEFGLPKGGLLGTVAKAPESGDAKPKAAERDFTNVSDQELHKMSVEDAVAATRAEVPKIVEAAIADALREAGVGELTEAAKQAKQAHARKRYSEVVAPQVIKDIAASTNGFKVTKAQVAKAIEEHPYLAKAKRPADAVRLHLAKEITAHLTAKPGKEKAKPGDLVRPTGKSEFPDKDAEEWTLADQEAMDAGS